jgi:hypothetical protein
MIVTFRPDRIGPDGSGAILFASLSPELADASRAIEQRTGFPLAQLRRITIAVSVAGDQPQLATTISVVLSQPQPEAELAERIGLEAAQTETGKTIYLSDKNELDAFYFAASTDSLVDRFAVGNLAAIKEVAEIDGAAIPLPRTLDDLWQGIGKDPDFAMLCTTNFLFADGRQIIGQYASQAYEPLRRFLIPDAAGVAIRMDFAPRWFAEVRLAPGGGISPAALRKKVEDRLQQLPGDAEQFVIESNPHPSWKALAIRLPAMVRALRDASRTGIVNGNAVANFYLPEAAAPNVLLAGWLALNTPPGASNSNATGAGTTTGPQLTSIEQLLDVEMRIRFAQESLEMASGTVQDQFNATTPPGSLPLKIAVLGGDLQLEGITQNQQIRQFDHPASTLRQVLDDLVRRANPDQTATSLDQDAQKLVWAIGPDPDASNQNAILITTRAQALKKYQLPPQFVPGNNSQ